MGEQKTKDVRERLKRIRASCFRSNNAAMARAADMDPSTLLKAINGDTERVSAFVIDRVTEVDLSGKQVSRTWLIKGKGEMFSSTEPELWSKASSQDDRSRSGTMQTVGNEGMKTTEGDKRVLRLFNSTLTLNIRTNATTQGPPGKCKATVPDGFFRELIGVDLPQEIGISIAEGDTMEPTIMPDDMVIWRPIDRIPTGVGGIYAIEIDGDPSIKRIQSLVGNTYRIINDNRTRGYSPSTLVPTGNAHYNIEETGATVQFFPIGKVIWPTHEADRIHIQKVTQIIREMTRQEGFAKSSGLE